MRPEHTRPFNREHAEAGAPYCFHDGSKAEVLKWESGPGGGIATMVTGRTLLWATESLLVMTPLGMCQGKPVWWDSELLNARGSKFTANQTMTIFTFESCTWPVAAPVIETKMTIPEFSEVIMSVEHPGCGFNVPFTVMFGIANAAIARAVVDGQVVPMETYKAAEKESEEFAKMLHINAMAPLGSRIGGLKMARAARDMAVAVAVMNATRQGLEVNNFEGTTCLDWRNIDLAAIIAEVKP